MSRFQLTAKPEFAGYTVDVGYERHLPSFFAYVFDADGDLVVDEGGLLTPILDPAVVLDAVRPYADIPAEVAAILPAMPGVEKTATQRAAERAPRPSRPRFRLLAWLRPGWLRRRGGRA
jgi:hypothetical protein